MLTRAVALGMLLAAASGARAQQPPAGVPEFHTKLPGLSIPFSSSVLGSRVRDVELYVSTDRGRTWTYVTQQQISGRKEDNRFRYSAPSDGAYWFAVRSIDQAGTASPPSVEQLQPGLVVHLDRRAPLIQLRALTQTEASKVGVEWDIREENLDKNRFAFEYRVPGVSDWVPQVVRAEPTGTQFFQLTTAPRIEVRLRVADLAGNEAEATLSLSPGGGNAAATSNNSGASDLPPPPSSPGGNNQPATNPGRPGINYINTTQLAIPFRISNVGVSGVPVMELWVTRDQGRHWQKIPRGSDDNASLPATPGDGETISKLFSYAAPGEGLYGFTVVVRSGVGIGDPDPKPGDPPRKLVEVDTTKPEVTVNVFPGSAQDVRNVTIEWTSKDKNLGDRPVTLLWCKTRDGADWEPIIGDLDSKGRYVWAVPDAGPFQFYVRAQAVDKAKNIGSATHPQLVTVDLNRPRAELDDVRPLDKKP
ncbi:MAG: hypothetical protein K1X57_04820 [Gemmataceae bacterium]|nr:hypothetical protein [Gemmataceae bacterium]